MPSWRLRLPPCSTWDKRDFWEHDPQQLVDWGRNKWEMPSHVPHDNMTAWYRATRKYVSIHGSQPRILFQSYINPSFQKQAMSQSLQWDRRTSAAAAPLHPTSLGTHNLFLIMFVSIPLSFQKTALTSSSFLVKLFSWLPSGTKSMQSFLASCLRIHTQSCSRVCKWVVKL